MNNPGFPVRIIGRGGQPFVLQSSADLKDWIDLTHGLLLGDYFDFSDSEAANHQFRFYRAAPLR